MGGDDAVAFFDFFASPPEDFQPRALDVLNEGLAAGDSPVLARRATRLLQAMNSAQGGSVRRRPQGAA